MYIKVHKSGEKEILAVCDEDLIGKKLEQGDICLDILETFYKGEKVEQKQLESILENYDNINIVGPKSIKIALDINIIKEESIIRIQGVPHAQIFTI